MEALKTSHALMPLPLVFPLPPPFDRRASSLRSSLRQCTFLWPYAVGPAMVAEAVEELIASNSGTFRPDRAAGAFHTTFSARFAEPLLEAAALALPLGQGLNGASERAHGLVIPLTCAPHELFLEIPHKRRARRFMRRGFTGGGHVVCVQGCHVQVPIAVLLVRRMADGNRSALDAPARVLHLAADPTQVTLERVGRLTNSFKRSNGTSFSSALTRIQSGASKPAERISSPSRAHVGKASHKAIMFGHGSGSWNFRAFAYLSWGALPSHST